MEATAPKKRGRKPLTAEQRAERDIAKRNRPDKHTPKHVVPPQLNVSFVCNDPTTSTSNKSDAPSHPPVMQASEIISLLNSQRTSSTTTPTMTNIPVRPVVTEQKQAHHKPHFREKQSQIMDESDDDEDASVSLRTQPKFMDMSTSSVCTIMAAHTSIDKWPERSSICCWHCCHTFQGIPIPATIKQDRKSQLIQTSGVFCSFNCAKRWILDKNTFSVGEQINLLHLLLKKVIGSYSKIRPAPPRIALTIFGGPLSLEEFREGNLQFPSTQDTSDDAKRSRIVKEIQHNCYPLFSRLLVESTQRGGQTVQHNPQPTRHERTKPLTTATLQRSMNMNVTIGNNKI